MNPIDFWFSMGSTYTYLTVSRLPAVQRSTGVSFRWRPFNLMRIFREADYFPFKEGANKTKHMWQDLFRRATLHETLLHLSVLLPARAPFSTLFTSTTLFRCDRPIAAG